MSQLSFLSRISKVKPLTLDYKPQFYRLGNLLDKNSLEQLLASDPEISIQNEITSQIEELIKCRNPKKVYNKQELTNLASTYLPENQVNDYGVWVYYPWRKKLVHLLDSEEFIEVRTNRNKYKITPKEADSLKDKKIGIIGLSVGQSIALTIIMERICGEIRLADFDVLELSNMNRIRSGVFNLNVPKTILVAREIAEIDPFINVKVFNDGITENNVDEFYAGGGKLDLCIEVCDGLFTKVFARHKAKQYKVPVVMNSSDRGTTDIERYDIDPDQPILHGLIDHLDIELVKSAKTNEEKVPFLLPMLGVDTSTDRLKSSMLEIQESITTWPQLASGVILGGGICADVSRRVLLNQLEDSGRYFVDLNELIKDKNNKLDNSTDELRINESITKIKMLEIVSNKCNSKTILKNQLDLNEDQVTKIVEAATKAPSGANCQSWKWLYHSKTLFLFFDDILRPYLLDCKRTTMLTGLGAAIENAVLKAHELGFDVILNKEELTDDSILIASFKFIKDDKKEENVKFEEHGYDYLSSAIDKRQSNRTIDFSKKQYISSDKMNNLKQVARSIPGAELLIVDDRHKLERLAEITARMDRIRYLSKGGHNDYRAEVRWTPKEAKETGTGISFQETMDLTPTEFSGFYVSKDWQVVKNIADWELGSGFGKIQRKWILSSACVGLITMPEFSLDNFLYGGRALERVWLEAQNKGIEVHPPSLSTLIFNTFQYGNGNEIENSFKNEIDTLIKEFEGIFNIDGKVAKILLLRFFQGEPSKYRSYRKPLSDILHFS
jgi:hypothetical protein